MGKRLTARLLAFTVLAMAGAAMIASVALDDDPKGLVRVAKRTAEPCAAATAATIARVDTVVAQRIYAGEERSQNRAVSADIAHVTGSRELLSALANSDGPAVQAAVQTIVYKPHWHIVRLRVVKNGRVVADVGGPHIIAPLSGVLKFKRRKVGRFVMSVQDDLGYVKLVSRFVGVPIDLYKGSSFVMGTLRPAPPSVQAGEWQTVGGRTYQAQVLSALAFPRGKLQVVLFLPKPTSAVEAQSCAAVRLAAWGSIGKHIVARYKPLSKHYRELVDTLHGATGPAFVRTAHKQLAGAVGPAKLPRSGTISYLGRQWSIFSWEPVPPARIYLLTSPN